MNSIKVIRKEPGGAYFNDILRNDLASFQACVGGYIEAVPIDCEGIIIVICDEEGRLKHKPYNCTIDGISFVGPIVIVGVDGEEFADAPISIKELEELTE